MTGRRPRVSPGDAIRVVAPSGPVPRDDFEAGVRLLAARYRPRYDPARIFQTDGFLAGSDEARLRELTEAIADPEARAIVMARGGHGLLRLLPFLDPEILRANPKPIVGFSDGTALLAYATRAGVPAIHGPVVTQLPRLPEDDRAALFSLLEGAAGGGGAGLRVLLSELSPIVQGRARGPLVGGNLEVLSRLLGTPYAPDFAGAILLLEDVGERPYRVDRLLTHLDLAGVFSAVAGVVVGDFIDCKEPEGARFPSPDARAVLEERLSRLAIPVLCDAPVGHGARNRALPLGVECEIDTRGGTLAAA